MKDSLIICSSSLKKFNEINDILSPYFDCVRYAINLQEIQGTSEKIIEEKIHNAYQKVQKPVLVDDVSFHFDVLGGFPGPYMKDMVRCMNPQKIAELFEGTKAQAICHLAYKKNNESPIIFAKGSISGMITIPIISEGYGFEPCFTPDGSTKTLVEMTIEEKNNCSHRGKALKNLLDQIVISL